MNMIKKLEKPNHDCVFCKIMNGEIVAHTLYENDNFKAIPDANPKVKGHSLVISKKHFETVLDMPVTLGGELVEAIKGTSIQILKDNKAEGFNVLQNNFKVAGQAVPHLHFHIFPRKTGEKIHFME